MSYQSPTSEPGLREGLIGEGLVAEFLPMRPGQARPAQATWVCLLVGVPPARGAV